MASSRISRKSSRTDTCRAANILPLTTTSRPDRRAWLCAGLFLVTLGTLELFTGIAIIITAGKPVSGLPPAYGEVFAGKLFGVIPVPVIVFAVAVAVVGLVLNKTAFGTKILMLGTNATAAAQLDCKGYATTGCLARGVA